MAMADSMGLSPAEAQTFASSSGGFNQANLPSSNASEMMGALGPGGLPGGGGLAQIIGQAESGNNPNASLVDYAGNRSVNAQYQQSQAYVSQYGSGEQGITNQAQQLLAGNPNATLGTFYSLYNHGQALPWDQYSQMFPEQAANFSRALSMYGASPSSPLSSYLGAIGGAGGVGGLSVPSQYRTPWDPQGTAYSQIASDPQGIAASMAASDPFGTGAQQSAFLNAGFPLPASNVNGFGYPAYGASTMSDSLLGNMGFSTSGDYTSQMLDQMGIGYGDAGYGGGSSPSDNSNSSFGVPAYTYGNDIGNNPSDYSSNIGGYGPSYGADFGTGGVTDLGTDTTGSYNFGGDSGGFSGDSGGYSGVY